MSEQKEGRKLTKWDWVAVGGLCIYALLAMLYTAIGTDGIFRLLGLDDAASWAQAVFSALAVFAAIGVVWWQTVHAQRERTKDEARKLENLGTQIFFCRVIAMELEIAVIANVSGTNLWAALKSHVAGFSAVPTFDFPTWRAGFCVAQIQAAFLTLEFTWNGSNGKPGEWMNHRHPALRVFMQWLYQAEATLLAECESRGGKVDGIRHQLSDGHEAVFGRAQAVRNHAAALPHTIAS